MNGRQLARARTAIAEKEPERLATLSCLLEQAEAALNEGPFTVMHKTSVPPGGDRHDYYSVGPYWWPDPQSGDGLPYIRRDGLTNPERRTDATDSVRISRMADAVATLSLAYGITGREPYAERAAVLLRTWFLDTGTRMNPHLRYGQAIPGRVEGRGIGIIDTVCLLPVVDAVGLLAPSESWTDNDHDALQQWFAAYLRWLQTSQHGIDEGRTRNNHGSWYDAQVARFAHFVGDPETLKQVLQSVGEQRISRQIGPDGRQNHELARTRSFHYSIYNLSALFYLAGLGEHADVDLWNFASENSAGLRGALDYLASYADVEKKWPHEQITECKRANLLPLLRQGFQVYSDQEYRNMIQKIPHGDRVVDMSRLLYPDSIP